MLYTILDKLLGHVKTEEVWEKITYNELTQNSERVLHKCV